MEDKKFEHKENTGSIFKNNRKEGKQPDYWGTANINGEIKRISGWINTPKSGGDKYIHIVFQEPYNPENTTLKKNIENTDDDLPF